MCRLLAFNQRNLFTVPSTPRAHCEKLSFLDHVLKRLRDRSLGLVHLRPVLATCIIVLATTLVRVKVGEHAGGSGGRRLEPQQVSKLYLKFPVHFEVGKSDRRHQNGGQMFMSLQQTMDGIPSLFIFPGSLDTYPATFGRCRQGGASSRGRGTGTGWRRGGLGDGRPTLRSGFVDLAAGLKETAAVLPSTTRGWRRHGGVYTRAMRWVRRGYR
jgi:hypothetical protein